MLSQCRAFRPATSLIASLGRRLKLLILRGVALVRGDSPVLLELWADSFHEGRWALEQLADHFDSFSLSYERGFLPVATVTKDGATAVLHVLGDYRAWTPIPDRVSDVLAFGKPDLLVYDRTHDRVLFALEETAAVPTGNQSLQRCERMVGACLQQSPVPFAYLLPEYGMHLDANARRASVWPFLLAQKLTDQYDVPSVILTYGSRDAVEDYAIGDGVAQSFALVASVIYEAMGLPSQSWEGARDELLEAIRAGMLVFVADQAAAIMHVQPPRVQSGATSDTLDWPLSAGVVGTAPFLPGAQLRPDPFLTCVEQCVRNRAAYSVTPGAGSRPQPLSRLEEYTGWHRTRVLTHPDRPADYTAYSVDPSAFPSSKGGGKHVTSSKDIVFLFDSGAELTTCYGTVFGARGAAAVAVLNEVLGDRPSFLYVSASMKPGRVFGDPYSGQLSCYAQLFARDHNNERSRSVVAYFPLQSFAIFPNSGDDWARSKGLRLYMQLVDLIICDGGVVVLPQHRRVI